MINRFSGTFNRGVEISVWRECKIETMRLFNILHWSARNFIFHENCFDVLLSKLWVFEISKVNKTNIVKNHLTKPPDNISPSWRNPNDAYQKKSDFLKSSFILKNSAKVYWSAHIRTNDLVVFCLIPSNGSRFCLLSIHKHHKPIELLYLPVQWYT